MKLLNHMILYTLIDTRYVIDDSVIRDIQNDEALVNLIMRNWINIDGLSAIIRNIFQENKPKYGGFYGDSKMNNEDFIQILKQNMLSETVRKLNLTNKSSSEILLEIEFIRNQLSPLIQAAPNSKFLNNFQIKNVQFVNVLLNLMKIKKILVLLLIAVMIWKIK